MAMARSFSDYSAICYALPVFLYDVIFSHNGQCGAWRWQ